VEPEVDNLGKIRVAVAGVGNCCSSLVQGVCYNRDPQRPEGKLSIAHPELGGYKIEDIEFVAAFDVDARKVRRDLSEAIFAEPNNAPKFCKVPEIGVKVMKGELLDGVGQYASSKVSIDNSSAVDVKRELERSRAEVLVNFLPTGAIEASGHYAECSVEGGCGFLNATPTAIASDVDWQRRFERRGVPVAGDDIMDQLGSTVLHKTVLRMLAGRGVAIDESYQLDIGGGTESLNALERERSEIKRKVKSKSVMSVVPYPFPLVAGSSDYVDFMENARTSYFWIKGKYFAEIPFTMDIRLNLFDGPASSSTILDAVRIMKIALDRGISGPLISLSAYGFKMPPEPTNPEEANNWLMDFVAGKRDR
jgi:myo-inositol-1-phosphate synthase